MFEYIKMPQPLLVLGAMYIVVAVFYLWRFIGDAYWHGVYSNLKNTMLSKWPLVILALIMTLVLVKFVDLPIALLCRNHYNHSFYRVVDFINSMGEGWFVGGVLFTCFLIFQFLGNAQMAIVSKISFMASIYAGLFNAIIKFIFNRERPGVGMNQWHFFHFFATGAIRFGDLFYASNSMPSGHTITIYAAITPFLLVAKTRTVKITLVLIALLICFARVYTLNHWLSDVYIATLFGIFIGRANFLCNQYRLEERSNDRN